MRDDLDKVELALVVPDSTLACIGDVIASFQLLEDFLRSLLSRYLSPTDETIGDIVASNLSFAALRATPRANGSRRQD